MSPYISSLNITGFKPFRDTTFNFGQLEVIAGVNGSGKTSLFEFLQFLRDAVDREIPPEIVKGSVGQQIFHIPGEEKFSIIIEASDFPYDMNQFIYELEVDGPAGFHSIPTEKLINNTNEIIFDRHSEIIAHKLFKNYLKEIKIKRLLFKREGLDISNFSNFILGWRFYCSFTINTHKIRKSSLVEQEPTLHEDAGNLSSVLHFLMTEHKNAFEELEFHLKSVIPGFKGITVKARGGPGEVIAFWKEEGIDGFLTLADLSDGIIRLICWITLCVHPNPPSLICIDEPDQGVHPRTLPILASLFEKASERTQILLATHSSYFLSQFDISRIAVMKKENGEALYLKPKDSKILIGMLDDFGPDELEIMHRSDELETFS